MLAPIKRTKKVLRPVNTVIKFPDVVIRRCAVWKYTLFLTINGYQKLLESVFVWSVGWKGLSPQRISDAKRSCCGEFYFDLEA
jgi:hypothetical protein